MFTIEDLIEKIYEPKSKELFRDIYTSYTQGQYRATIVMLWTVVVCDLVYKLQYLRDVYNDTTAIDILSKITEKQTNDKRKSEWENYLVEKVKDRTQLITDIEKESLEYLQKQRNLCAHPIITNENILFKPNKELTRSLMRIALETTLLKSPLLTKKYVDTILEDIEKRADDFFPWDNNFERYCQNRYLNHLNENQILNLFKLLWRLIFLPHNDREETNSFINFQLFKYIFSKYRQQCINFMQDNIDLYSYDSSNKNTSEHFNSFIIENSGIYTLLSEQTKALFESESRIFPQNLPYYFISNKSFNDYLNMLNEDFNNRKETIKNNSIWLAANNLQKQAKELGLKDNVYNLFIQWYAKSLDFNEADTLFNEIIRHNYKDFSIGQITMLIKECSNNNQTYNRARATYDHKLIVKRFIDLHGNYEDINNTPFEDLYIELGGVPF